MSRNTVLAVAVFGWFLTNHDQSLGQNWSFSKIADTSTAIPQGSGNFTDFFDPAISNGLIVFRASGSNGQRGIYSKTISGAIQVVANRSSVAPNGGQYTSFSRPDLDALGNIAFYAATDSVATPQGIYARLNGTMRTIATVGTATPGFATGSFYTFEAVSMVSIDQGQVVFGGYSRNIQSQINEGLYRYSNTVISLVADRNTLLPFGNGTTTMSLLHRPMINNGNIIFEGFSNTASGVYSVRNSVLQREIDSSQFLPNSTTLYQAEGSPQRGPSLVGNQSNFFSSSTPFGQPVMGQYGTDVDGLLKAQITNSTLIPGSSSTFSGHGYLGLNADGSGSFATFASGSTISGLWYSPTFTGLGLESIIVNDFALDGKIVSLPGSGIYALDGNQFVFQTRFTDGSSGIYLAVRAVPEPATLFLLSVALVSGVYFIRRVRQRQSQLTEAVVESE